MRVLLTRAELLAFEVARTQDHIRVFCPGPLWSLITEFPRKHLVGSSVKVQWIEKAY